MAELTDDASSWQLKVHACRGFAAQGMFAEALRELNEIGFKSGDPHYDFILEERCRIHLLAGDFERVNRLARELGRSNEDSPQWMILLAESQRVLRGAGEADAILANAEFLHCENATIPFNRSCIASAEGRLEDAKGHLLRAVALDPSNLARARLHQDLEPLREWIDESD